MTKNKHLNCTIYTLKEAIDAPATVLQTALQTLNPNLKSKPIAIPKMVDSSKLDALVRKLVKNGVLLDYKPDKKKKKAPKGASEAVNRPNNA